jgi:hypothetical protein
MKLKSSSRLSPGRARAETVDVIDYWIVVRRGKEEIKEVLEIAFRGKTAFSVIEDRRVTPRRVPAARERREAGEILKMQDFIVAERRRG